ncbi:hypothetical protein FGSG_10955 [Fusarium graminearum PH-1]|uniref:Chromosome 3, complete genome n=1 Tax=Gibberella zeae (strain ATCC MYA-4620 / CBS 123657 / FGSC 9075 / NRRL 31084 / PH-1) TaxID=229533 RepID=I1S2G1_GIBZE|nr:hypothetical protein FGSG_10955 [Fusarium graminearum PH-1]ESU17795.1 hypothetical protein FGSG_10955 [Fusarium graminearum PH-1]CEF88628.1 unnamed protein product [Fusarium graminearum]|eukprot:XP_011325417.1 hypothetical protein FGSG_10955 [Fusarium graminearum PH-1]
MKLLMLACCYYILGMGIRFNFSFFNPINSHRLNILFKSSPFPNVALTLAPLLFSDTDYYGFLGISHIMPSTNFPAGSVEEAVQEAQSALADYLDLDLTFEKAQAELAKWEAIRDQPAAAQAAIDAGKEEKKKKKKKKEKATIIMIFL